MWDLAYNIALSAGLTGSTFLAEHLLARKARVLFKERPRKPKPHNKNIELIADSIKQTIEDFLKVKIYEKIGDEGSFFDATALVEAKIAWKTGRLKEDIFMEERKKPDKYQFIVNYGVGQQHGFETTQPYVEIMAMGLAKAINDLGYPLAINAVGTNFTVVKSFRDSFDMDRFQQLHIEPRLNLYQGIRYSSILDFLDPNIPSLVFNILNGQVPIADKERAAPVQFDTNSILLTYAITNDVKNKTPVLDISDLGSMHTRVCSRYYEVSNAYDMPFHFKDLMENAQRCR